MTAAPQHELETEVQITPDCTAQVILHGRLDAQTVPGCWNDLQTLRSAEINKLVVDASASATVPGWHCSAI
jgi:anti-anti-sigma regulatory factor